MVMICPEYEGSVRTSWYPVIDVLKTTSPKAVPRAPYASPRNTRPSSSISTAGWANSGSSGAGGQVHGRAGDAGRQSTRWMNDVKRRPPGQDRSRRLMLDLWAECGNGKLQGLTQRKQRKQ